MEREKILAALLEHLDPALPEVVLTCDFHLQGQIDFLFTFSQFKLVFCHEIKRDAATHFVWTDCPSCYGSSLSAGFFFLSFASSASFTQTLQTSFSRSLLTGSRQSEMLSAPPPLSLSQPTFNPNLKTQLRSALSPSANVHRATRHTVSCRLATSSVRTSCSPAPWQPPTISGFISPQGFNTLEAHASSVSDLEY